jgi:hypothetical protein
MTSELVHRIRTCAAALLANDKAELSSVQRDAADLMIEASNRLDVPEDLRGELMPIIKEMPHAAPGPSIVIELPALPIEGVSYATPPCPECANISPRTVRRVGRKLMLTCPMCNYSWEYVA